MRAPVVGSDLPMAFNAVSFPPRDPHANFWDLQLEGLYHPGQKYYIQNGIVFGII